MSVEANDPRSRPGLSSRGPCTVVLLRSLVSVCLLLSVGLSTLPAGYAADDDEYWDTPFRHPQYLIHIIETNGKPDDRYILYPVAPDKNGLLHTADGSGGYVGHKATVVGGAYKTPRQVCAAAGGVPDEKMPINCAALKAMLDCNIVCKKRFEHGAWDGKSEYPCDCVCELGWGFDDNGNCVECDKLCKATKIEHYVYDKRNREVGACPCVCEDGYRLRGDTCQKVGCPDNSVNIADIQSPSSPVILVCPEHRLLSVHCCCDVGYVPWGGVCIKKEEIPKRSDEPEPKPEPNRDSCKDFGVLPKDFDLVYDQGLLAIHFEDFIDQYKGPLWRGSRVVKGSLTETRDFFFHLGYTDDQRFHTGKEAELQQRLAAKFQSGGQPLTPAQAFEQSLELNDGYVFDALLTCHNLLRQDAYKHRDEVKYQNQLAKAQSNVQQAQTAQARKQAQQNLAFIQAQIAANKNIYGALQVIRTSKDNVGAWYHLFGTMTAGFGYSIVGVNAVSGEKQYRKDYSGDPDPLERCWDQWGAVLGWRLKDLKKIKYRQRPGPGLGSNASTIKSGYQGTNPAPSP